MTKIQQFLADLPEEKKSLFVPVFGSMEKFYTVPGGETSFLVWLGRRGDRSRYRQRLF